MISFDLSREQEELIQSIQDFAHSSLGEVPDAFRRPPWDACGTQLLQGLAIPKEYGGRGLNASSTLLALEALGYANPDNGLNFAISAHLLACAIPIWLFGSDALKKRILPDLCTGKLIAANAMTEPSSGSDAYTMQTIAKEESSLFIITGEKTFVSNGPIADGYVLYAATDPSRGYLSGISAFWVPRQSEGLQASSGFAKAGLHSCPLGSVFFEQLRLDKSLQIGRTGKGAFIFNKSMEWERTCLGGCHLGNMKRLLEKASKAIMATSTTDHQYASHQLATYHWKLKACRLLSLKAAWKMDQGQPAHVDAAMAKLAVSELYREITNGLSSLLGPAYYEDPDFVRSAQDAISSTIYSGTSEMQRTIIAGALGLRQR